MIVKTICPISKTVVSMDIPNLSEIEYKRWMKIKGSHNRPLIQDLLPKLTQDEREFLLTSLLPEVWKANVGNEVWKSE